jgi:uncharacterized membrane protein
VIETPRSFPKKLSYALLGLLLVYAVVRCTVAARAKLFWFDELLTLRVALQPNWHAIMEALRAPIDGQPPLFHLIEKFALGLTRNQEIALRLPSIVAMPVTLACIFVFARKRWGHLIALVCSSFLLMTVVFRYYAEEARPYSMEVACFALALVCYQRAERRWWVVGLALSLALAQSLHYYAVLAMVPFGLAELVLAARTRRIRWGVWAAFVVGAAPLLLFWNLLQINGAYWGGRFWARYQFTYIPHTYGQFLQTEQESGAAFAVAALLGVLVTYFAGRPSESGEETPTRHQEASEATLLLGLAALPVIAYLATKVMHSGLDVRYVLPTTVGMSLAFGYALSRTKLKTTLFVAILMIAFLTVQELSFWRTQRRDAENVAWTPAGIEKFIDGAGYAELPVVVPSAYIYAAMVHYGSAALDNRIVYLAQDPPGHMEGGATFDQSVYLLNSYWPFRMDDFMRFAAAHPKFLMYVEERMPGYERLMVRLVQEGWTVRAVELDPFRGVYLVSAKGSPQ